MSGELSPRMRECIPAKSESKWTDLRRPLCGRSARAPRSAPRQARAPHGVLRMSDDVPAAKANAVEANRKQWGIGAEVGFTVNSLNQARPYTRNKPLQPKPRSLIPKYQP